MLLKIVLSPLILSHRDSTAEIKNLVFVHEYYLVKIINFYDWFLKCFIIKQIYKLVLLLHPMSCARICIAEFTPLHRLFAS